MCDIPPRGKYLMHIFFRSSGVILFGSRALIVADLGGEKGNLEWREWHASLILSLLGDWLDGSFGNLLATSVGEGIGTGGLSYMSALLPAQHFRIPMTLSCFLSEPSAGAWTRIVQPHPSLNYQLDHSFHLNRASLLPCCSPSVLETLHSVDLIQFYFLFLPVGRAGHQPTGTVFLPIKTQPVKTLSPLGQMHRVLPHLHHACVRVSLTNPSITSLAYTTPTFYPRKPQLPPAEYRKISNNWMCHVIGVASSLVRSCGFCFFIFIRGAERRFFLPRLSSLFRGREFSKT